MSLVSYRKLLTEEIQTTPQEVRVSETWLAELDTPTEDVLESGRGRIPDLFARHPDYEQLFLIESTPTRNADVPQCWNLRHTYSNRYVNGQGQIEFGPGIGLPIEDPLAQPAIIKHGSYTSRKEWEFTYDEQDELKVPVITTAGEPIYLEDEVEYPVISIQKNVSQVRPVLAKTRRFINQDAVRISNVPFEKDTLMARNIEISDKQIKVKTTQTGIVLQRYEYYVLNFKLFFNEEGWSRKLRNAGFLGFDNPAYRIGLGPVTNRKVRAIKVGNPPAYPTNPVPIMPDGSVYPEFQAATKQDPVDPARLREIWREAVLTFRTAKRINFNGTLPLR